MDSGRSRCSKMVTSNQAFPYASTQKFEFLQLLKSFYIPKYSCWLNVPLPQVEYTQIFGLFRVQQPESLITIFKEFFSSHSITLLLAQRSIAAGWVSSAVSHSVIELSYWRSMQSCNAFNWPLVAFTITLFLWINNENKQRKI